MPVEGDVNAPAEGQAETTPPDYRPYIPEAYRADKVWETTPDLPTALKNYAEAHRYAVGAIKLPKSDATPEEWGKVYSKLGRPEAADGYTFDPQSVSLPENVGVDEKALTEFKQFAHGAGLSDKQFSGVLGWFYGNYVNQQAAVASMADDQAYDACMSTLQGEWGAAFERKKAVAEAVLTKLGDQDLLKDVANSDLANSPRFIRWLASVGEQLLEDGVLTGVNPGGTSKQGALDRIAELTRDAGGPYRNRKHPDHERAVEEVTRLYEIAYN